MKRLDMIRALAEYAEMVFADEEGSPTRRSTGPLDWSAPPRFVLPGLRRQPFHDPLALPWTRELAAEWQVIRDEALAAMRAHRERFRQYDDEGLDDIPGWNALHLHYRDERNPRNAELCPRTVAALARVPRRMGVNFFSWMAPGVHIPPHQGPCNLWWTYHLALVVPEPERCELRVGDQRHRWAEGESVLFEDSYVHAAHNQGRRDRLILLLQIWHPDLDDEEVEVLTGIERQLTRFPSFQESRLRKLA